MIAAKDTETLSELRLEAQALLEEHPKDQRLRRLRDSLTPGAGEELTVSGQLTLESLKGVGDYRAPARARPRNLLWEELRNRGVTRWVGGYLLILIAGSVVLSLTRVRASPAPGSDTAALVPAAAILVLAAFGLAAVIIMAWHHGSRSRSV
jgi:hypothetical protein